MLDSLVVGMDHTCARLRTPGRIQCFGAMLVVHPRTLRVLNASENCASEFGIANEDLIGRALTELIGPLAMRDEIRRSAEAEYPNFQNPIPVELGGRRFDTILHAHDGVIFAEFEPLRPGAATRPDLDRLSEGAIIGMMVPDTMAALLQAGPSAVRAATDFDRVLLYRFDEAYRGQVVGEALRPGVDSFMGLFFPSSDIPPQARELYEQTSCRYIPRIDGGTYRVLPVESPLTGRPLDMSHAVLRGVAPCHIEYLSNMGVAASMSFSIMSEGKLWGMFACHHYQSAQLSYVQRLVCDQIAMMFAAKLNELINPAAIVAVLEHRRSAVLANSPVCRSDPLAQPWSPSDEMDLLALVEADSAAIYIDGEVGHIGNCPDFSDLHAYIRNEPTAFARLLHMYDDAGLFHTNAVSTMLPFGEKMRQKGSGVLVIPLARNGKNYLIWFRPELVVKATWAGNPSDMNHREHTTRFTPRKSFAAWKEDIRDRAEPWTMAQIANAVALRDHVLALRTEN